MTDREKINTVAMAIAKLQGRLTMDEFTRTARMIREVRPLVFKGTVGYDFCVCENCRQKVDAHDVYCRQCGRVLVKGADDNAGEA